MDGTSSAKHDLDLVSGCLCVGRTHWFVAKVNQSNGNKFTCNCVSKCGRFAHMWNSEQDMTVLRKITRCHCGWTLIWRVVAMSNIILGLFDCLQLYCLEHNGNFAKSRHT